MTGSRAASEPLRFATSRVSKCVISDVSVRLSSSAKRSDSIRNFSGNRRENVFFALIQASHALRCNTECVILPALNVKENHDG